MEQVSSRENKMGTKNPQVDGFIRKNEKWAAALRKLRAIILDSPLVEEVKWMVPCYTLGGKNVVFLGAFKEDCRISFVKGVLLKDPKGVLEKPGENTHVVRMVKFSDAGEIEKIKGVLKGLVREAVDIEKAGVKPKLKKKPEAVPEELAARLDGNSKLKAAFGALTPGRQRLYIIHISGAKQSATRAARLEKCVPRILAGKGLND